MGKNPKNYQPDQSRVECVKALEIPKNMKMIRGLEYLSFEDIKVVQPGEDTAPGYGSREILEQSS